MTRRNRPKDAQVPLTEIHLLGGSPLLVADGRPIAWFENWLHTGFEDWLRSDPAGVRRLYEGRWTIDESPGGYR